jgi:hypothetical protein
MLVGKLSQHIHEAGTADVVPTDANHDQLTLTYADGRPPVEFEWNDSDDRVHMSVGPDNKGNIVDHGPVVESPVTRFHLTRIDTTMVELTIAELQSANGDSVRIASRFTLLGR